MSVSRALIAIAMCGGVAHAGPGSVVVADDDPELLHALQSSLAPWQFVVISDPAADDDPARVTEYARRNDARFIVWREDDQLVVFDRELGSTERRPSPSGRLDAPNAAAAALTVKTLMRLPPAPERDEREQEEREYDPSYVSGPPPPNWRPESWMFRAHASALSRTTGGRTEPTAQLGVAYRPTNRRGWRFGAIGEISTASDFKAAGFTGSWREAGMFAVVSWAHGFQREDRWAMPRFELEPWVAGGAVYGALEGREGMDERVESAWMPAVRGGLTGWWLLGSFRVGATTSVEGRWNAPTFAKETMGMGMPEVFTASRIALGIGVVAAVELAP